MKTAVIHESPHVPIPPTIHRHLLFIFISCYVTFAEGCLPFSVWAHGHLLVPSLFMPGPCRPFPYYPIKVLESLVFIHFDPRTHQYRPMGHVSWFQYVHAAVLTCIHNDPQIFTHFWDKVSGGSSKLTSLRFYPCMCHTSVHLWLVEKSHDLILTNGRAVWSQCTQL